MVCQDSIAAGLHTSGETMEEVIGSIEIAKSLWLEMALEDTKPIPEPEPVL